LAASGPITHSQLDDGALAQPEGLADAHLRATDFQGQRDGHVEDDLDVRPHVAAAGGRA